MNDQSQRSIEPKDAQLAADDRKLESAAVSNLDSNDVHDFFLRRTNPGVSQGRPLPVASSDIRDPPEA